MATLLNANDTAAPPADLIKDTNTERFAIDVLDASTKVPVIVDFWAPWCGPCKQLGPVLERLVREYGGKVRLMKLNIDENQELAAQMRVQSIPMVIAFKNGRPVDGFAGAVPESQVRSFIDRLTGGGGSPVDQALAEAKQILEEGDHETAGQVYLEILGHEPNNPAAHAGYARTLIAGGNVEEAREYVEGLTDQIRNSSDVSGVISALELAAQTGDSGAVDELRAKLAQDANDHQARYDLALALYGQNKAEDAVNELVEIVRRKRDWNEDAARKQLVKIFEALGHTNAVTVAGRRKLSSVLFS
jgi:putative thioredoxin